MKMLVVLALSLATAACNKDTEAKPGTSAPAASNRFEIAVTEKGFEPDDIKVPAGKPVTLVFNRKTDQTCAKQVVINLGGDKKIEKALPLNTPVEIDATFPTAGKIGYACGMDMVRGTLTVQ